MTMRIINSDTKILERFLETLPEIPFCTDRLSRLYKLPIDLAKEKRYIQHNSKFDLVHFVYDVDRPMSIIDWQDYNVPVPNITATNPENGHSHIFYTLQTPVIKAELNPKVHRKPIRYAAAVDVALTKQLRADIGYRSFICKNPLNKHWKVIGWKDQPYTLGELSAHLDLAPYTDMRKRIEGVGLGRNCTIFEVTRNWSYREARKESYYFGLDWFVYMLVSYALGYNSENFRSNPLPHSEIRSIGRSIGKWVFTHMSHDGFLAWCRRRAKIGNARSIEVRQAAADIRNEKIIEYAQQNPHATYRQIARIFEVNEKTIKRLKPREIIKP